MTTARKFDINQMAAIAASMNGSPATQAAAANRSAPGTALHHLHDDLQGSLNPNKDHLTPWSRFMLRWEESGLARKAEAGIARHRWGEIEAFVKENIGAEVNLLREQSRVEFANRFGAIAERAMASESVAVNSIFAAMEAGLDLIYRDVAQMLENVGQQMAEGTLDDHAFRSRVASIYRRRDIAVSSLEASCSAKFNAIRNAYGRR